MVMHALDRKLLRDFRRLATQAMAIALVLACGVSALLTSYGMYSALGETRTAYYERNRFADLWAEARRAPVSLMTEIAAIPGVQLAEARVTGYVTLDLAGREEVAVGHIVSLPTAGLPNLNQPILRSGTLPGPDAADEVAVNEPFALANGYRPGDRIIANLNGARRELTITGTILSPEFIYTLGPGALLPDNAGFGILWMPERAAAAAFDMTGAFNSVTLSLDPSASVEEVTDRLDDLLEPYGGLGAYGRDRQISDSFISAEIGQLRAMTVVLPPIFFAVAAFLVNMLLGRIVLLERSEIGLLKALGYSKTEISLHYMLLAGLTALVGIAIGWVAGAWMAHGLATLYADFFNFPYLIFSASWSAYGISGLLGLVSAALGALRAALHAANLPPAVAMQPPAPPRFRRNLADRVLSALRISQPSMMILRSLLRWPVRAALTSFGLAMAVAVLTGASFFDDALDKIMDTAFSQANRQDAILMFTEDVPETALDRVADLPGVMQAEGQLFQSAVLHHGSYDKHAAIEARRPGTDLSRVIDGRNGLIATAEHGIVLSTRLAGQLHATVGQSIDIEFLTGRRETFSVPVTGIIEQYFGLGAYMDFAELTSLRRHSALISVANLTLDDTRRTEFHAALKKMPRLSGAVMLTDMRRSFEDTIQKNVTITATVYIVIALLITIGVTYNGARIQLSERARELASLRILGFTRAEVSYILVGESLVLAILAQPVGWLAGMGIAYAMTQGVSSDLYAIPYVIKTSTFSYASLVVLITALAAALVVRRRIDRLDLVAVMKTRE
jgi:putative ABC transport system permease protein